MSTLKVDKIDPQTGTALEIGSSGDTMTVPSGATFTVAGTLGATSAANLTSIPAANITGTIAAVSGANLTALNATQLTSGAVPRSQMPAGSVIQVIQAVKDSVWSNDTDDYVDITDLTADITPTDNTNKVLVCFSISASSSSGQRFAIRMLADGTQIAVGAVRSNRTRATSLSTTGGANDAFDFAKMYLHSPTTTSTVTYKLQGFAEGSGANQVMYVNQCENDGDESTFFTGYSTLTLMEISA